MKKNLSVFCVFAVLLMFSPVYAMGYHGSEHFERNRGCDFSHHQRKEIQYNHASHDYNRGCCHRTSKAQKIVGISVLGAVLAGTIVAAALD